MLHRRTFLRVLLTTASSLGLGACADDLEGVGPLTPGEGWFPNSVVSGDPRPESVILWTRVEDPQVSADADLDLWLQVATDEAFTDLVALDGGDHLVVTAEAAFDRCVKVKVTGLEPATTYYYRFIYPRDRELELTVDIDPPSRYVGRTGRTRTAPAADADTPVRFAYVSCQDYIGRYYNVYRELLKQDLDFFVHLGDYIYETSGDPSFQEATGRGIDFDDKAGAIELGEGDEAYYAARSLDNYRQLYRTYRSDPALQAVHERLPMIPIWDDHEFTDDCHGATATYTDGREDETDEARRKAANQAWFEYMPVDYPAGDDFRYDPAAAFPGDLRIHRDLAFGKHLQLVLTDLRTYRSDHLVPEDAFPGAVFADQGALEAGLGALPDSAQPYFDVDTFAGGIYGAALRAAAPALGYDAAKITGNMDAAYVDGLVDDLNAAVSADLQVPPLDPADIAAMERGLAYIHFGKGGFYSSFGSRYLVARDTLDIASRLRWAADNGASEQAMGPDQEAWFLETLKGSTSTWKVWANEFTLMPMRVDLRGLGLPAAFDREFYIVADSWDGQPKRRDALLGELAGVENLVAITGDIHAFYAGTPWPTDDPNAKVIELVTSSVTSTTFQRELEKLAAGDPTIQMIPGASALASSIRDFLVGGASNPHMAHADVVRNGFVSVELDGAAFTATFHAIDDAESSTDYAAMEDALSAKFERVRFRVNAGERELYRESVGAWQRWDPNTRTWV